MTSASLINSNSALRKLNASKCIMKTNFTYEITTRVKIVTPLVSGRCEEVLGDFVDSDTIYNLRQNDICVITFRHMTSHDNKGDHFDMRGKYVMNEPSI